MSATVIEVNNNGSTVVEIAGNQGPQGPIISIPTLPDATTVNAADEIIVQQGGITKRATGAELAKGLNEINNVFSVKDYGAAGDGVTNDHTAIDATISAAIASGAPATVYFPTAEYLCSSVLGPYAANNLTVDLNGSTINFSGVTGTVSCLEFVGATADAKTLTASANSRATTLSVDTAGLAVGDMFLLRSDTIFDPNRTSSKFGEINFVKSVLSGSSLETELELQATYTTGDAARISKLTPVRNLIICNGTLVGPAANDILTGIRIENGYACLVHNIKSYDFDLTHVRLDNCVYSKVSDCHFQESNHATQAYGVSFRDATQDCVAIGNTFVDVRHSLSTNNRVTTGAGITRRIVFANNVVSDSAPSTGGSGGDAIDTHAAAEDICIFHNTVNSSSNHGINVEARSAMVVGNIIRNTVGTGINMRPSCAFASSFVINDNDLKIIGVSPNLGNGIRVTLFEANCEDVVISGNRVVSRGQPIVLSVGGAQTFNTAVINGNVALRDGTITTSSAVEAANARAAVTGNVVLGNNNGITLSSCSYSTVSGNSVTLTATSGSTAFGIRLSGTTEYTTVTGNSCVYAATGVTTSIGVSFASGGVVTHSGAFCNVLKGFDTAVNVQIGTGVVAANNI